MRQIKKIVVWVLVLIMLAGAAACAQSASVGEWSAGLDLDYLEDENFIGDAAEATPEPWYAWFADAFSFGKTDAGSGGDGVVLTPQPTPDSVQEFYQQGSAPTEPPNVDGAGNTAATPLIPQNTPARDRTTSAPGQSATPVPTIASTPAPKGNTVTMTIRCDTAVANGMHLESKWAGIVPASGVILPATVFEIEEGDTVLDVLIRTRDKYKLHMEYSGTKSGAYVEGINNLYEFDGGRWSGWMYCVNGWYPNYGCGVYFLKAGDVVEWNYTCDLGLDLDSGWWDGAEDWKNTHD